MLRLIQVSFRDSTLHEQLSRVWEYLRSVLRDQFFDPRETTTVAEFMRDLDEAYNAVRLRDWEEYDQSEKASDWVVFQLGEVL